MLFTPKKIIIRIKKKKKKTIRNCFPKITPSITSAQITSTFSTKRAILYIDTYKQLAKPAGVTSHWGM